MVDSHSIDSSTNEKAPEDRSDFSKANNVMIVLWYEVDSIFLKDVDMISS